MPDPQVGPTVTLTVNDRAIQARRGELLIAAAERHGIYIPRFCWHPRMRSVGMCRMCLVEIEGPRGPAIQPACMQPVAEGMVVHSHSNVARKVQEGVLEYLLIHHPLDCPVCDRGGECPLQDETMTWGPGETRFVEEKRHYAKPIPVNDLVLLDRERCILCDRCVRFAKEVAGDPLLVFTERGNATQVLTFPDHPFASYFSGNTVQICPVGALTAVPYRFRARPWDLDQVESTCTTCAVGCRMVVQSTCNRLIRQGPLRLPGHRQRRPPPPPPRPPRRRTRRGLLGRGVRRHGWSPAGCPQPRRPLGRRGLRRRPADQRGRLRLGQTRQSHHRNRQRRRPTRRRPSC